MKQTCKNLTPERNNGTFLTLPPSGAYVAQIMAVRVLDADSSNDHIRLELMMEIIEGEYKGRYTEIYNNQKERFNAKYKGIFRIKVPDNDDEANGSRIYRNFQDFTWKLGKNNKGYSWDWNEDKLVGLKTGISIRKRMYTVDDKDYEAYDIFQMELIEEVHEGTVKPINDWDTRTKKEPVSDTAEASGYTAVNTSELPW